jgi:hypothetical protein
MINDTTTPKESNAAEQGTGGGWIRRLVRRLLVRLEGTDYKERFLLLAKHYALDLTEAHEERDEARELCRWAFPRLRAMCHDFDATDTGCACAEKMDEHSDIFHA